MRADLSGIVITIWDTDAARIAEIDRNLHLALQELKLKAVVKIISEPPLLARENLLNRVPVLEIEKRYWSLRPGEGLTQLECSRLLKKIFIDQK